ncbi:MAG: polysaccharide deacetylase family protein [Elusimicrobiota bacterium]|jgi:peptidoglycan/xylan/chitin deacetylase (PgdA/CDA1 family)|nr:polysaccharide deacetylase family protein [Elusimicrobiota bacterium]
MNILMALSQMEVTGAETYAVQITEELIDKGYNIVIVSDTLTKKSRAKYIPIQFNKRNLFNRISQIFKLIKIIRKYDIQLVNAHSRASSWSSYIACKLTNTAMIVSVHGRQSTKSLSRKYFKAFGDKIIAVNETLKEHLIKDLNVKPKNIVVLRNGVKINEIQNNLQRQKNFEKQKKVISIIGRLSGPKGVICQNLLEKVIDFDKYEIKIIGGKEEDKKIIEKYLDKLNFVGYVDNIEYYIKNSDLVIGAGRVAIETILMKIPLFAIGEAKSIGIINEKNIHEALYTNFGDITLNSKDFDWQKIKIDFDKAILKLENNKQELINENIIEIINNEYNLDKIVANIEKLYQHVYVKKHKYEIPILMYHRVIDSKSEKGKNGIYVTKHQFEEHMKILKNKKLEAINFSDLKKIGLHKRFEKNKKYVIITFDDGYKDNLYNALSILKKYNTKALVYLTNQTYNIWDVENFKGTGIDKRFDLMDEKEILEMDKSGLIEFGGHTNHHYPLTKLSLKKAMKEINENKAYIEKILNKKLISFSYPYGEWTKEIKDYLEKESNFDFAVTTDYGGYCLSDEVFAMRRIAIMPKITKSGFLRKIKGNYIFRRIKRTKV